MIDNYQINELHRKKKPAGNAGSNTSALSAVRRAITRGHVTMFFLSKP